MLLYSENEKRPLHCLIDYQSYRDLSDYRYELMTPVDIASTLTMNQDSPFSLIALKTLGYCNNAWNIVDLGFKLSEEQLTDLANHMQEWYSLAPVRDCSCPYT